MKIWAFLIFTILFSFLTACDEEEDTIPENLSPSTFDLLRIENGATDIDLTPTLSWNKPIDPEGDEITYEVFLGMDYLRQESVVNSLKNNEYKIEEELKRNQTYYWYVVASDSKSAKRKSSEIFSFTTGEQFFSKQAYNDNAQFSARRDHTLTAFNGKLWVIYGQDDSSYYNNIWSSQDGENWQLEAKRPFQFYNKNNHTSIEFKNRLWAIGGSLSEVYSSNNGKDWVLETSTASFGNPKGHSTIVFNDKLWVIGGDGGGLEETNEIWASANGVDWVQVIDNEKFPPRSSHSSVVFDDKIWVIGGSNAIINKDTEEQNVNTLEDVWYSDNGTDWTKLTVSEFYKARMGHASEVFKDKIIITGGLNINPSNNDRTHLNDVWVIQ